MKQTAELKLISAESLFSISGDFSDLEVLPQLACKYKALLFIDEVDSHSSSIFIDEVILKKNKITNSVELRIAFTSKK